MEENRQPQSEERMLINEIFSVTSIIQNKHLQLYFLLNETPLFLSNNSGGISKVDFQQYLETIKLLLETFEKAKT